LPNSSEQTPPVNYSPKIKCSRRHRFRNRKNN